MFRARLLEGESFSIFLEGKVEGGTGARGLTLSLSVP